MTNFNSGSNWLVGPDVNTNEGGLVSVEKGLVLFPKRGWNYTVNNTWKSDDTLKITEGEPEYPVQLIVSSSGEASKLYPDAMGVYRKIKGDIKHGRPVWKHIEHNIFLYYAVGHNHWNIGPSTDVEDGEWIHTKKFAQVRILGIEWIYRDDKNNIRDDDESLKVSDDK